MLDCCYYYINEIKCLIPCLPSNTAKFCLDIKRAKIIQSFFSTPSLSP